MIIYFKDLVNDELMRKKTSFEADATVEPMFFDDKQEFKIGNKAKNLIYLKQHHFEVPDGMVLSSDMYEKFIEKTLIKQKIEDSFNKLKIISKFCENTSDQADFSNDLNASGLNPYDSLRSISSELQEEMADLSLSKVFEDDVLNKMKCFIKKGKKYAVRSSGLLEDSDYFSFAGLYESFLELEDFEQIEKAVIKCYQSLFSERILKYSIYHDLDVSKLKMAVIIQEMVEADFAGVAFSVNPISGIDTQILVEMVEGLGENLVSGKSNPAQLTFDWKKKLFQISGREFQSFEELPQETHPIIKKFTQNQIDEMFQTFLEIQKLYGYPCDIEFAWKDEKLHILQSRAITKLQYHGITDLWSTADFKDGGVSATVCKPFMWSLYEYIWNISLADFVISSKILPETECQKPLGEMFYGRPYWNLSFVKKAMSKIVGYKEREFDSTYGVKMNYEGDGQTTGVTLSSLWRILKITVAQNRILKERQATAHAKKELLKNRYLNYKADLKKEFGKEEIEKIWVNLTQNDFLESESFYFWQIFINTVHQALNKDKLAKYVKNSEYLGLMSAIDDISHLRPFYEMWELSREIMADHDRCEYWKNTDIKTITSQIHSDHPYLAKVAQIIDEYGYHSDKELDVSYPCYAEDEGSIVKMIRENLFLGDECSPVQDREKQRKIYEESLEILKSKVSASKFKKLQKVIANMREMLWWREEFRDLSTMLYYIIRMYSLKLARAYVNGGILKEEDDIWMLKIADIWRFIEGSIDQKELDRIINQNKEYYQSFRNYQSENEIGMAMSSNRKNLYNQQDENDMALIREKSQAQNRLKGLGCNSGVIKGRVKVIRDMSEMDRLEVGDILVTKFTDTGWTSKFALLSGIITEYGGVLCHAAIVSREYGVCCIVAVEGAMSKIKDGALIQMNGETGEIEIIKEDQ